MKLFGKTISLDPANKRIKNRNLATIDINNIELGDSDAIAAQTGHINNVQFIQFERGQFETQRIETYRRISKTSEIDEVLRDVYNEAFAFELDQKAFSIGFKNGHKLTKGLVDKISEEVNHLYEISDFDEKGIEYFSNFYIDGRLVLQPIIDLNNPKKGIQKISVIDPLNIVKVKIIPQRDKKDDSYNLDDIQEFYVYSTRKFENQKNYLNNTYNNYDDVVEGLRIEKDYITYITSGITDPSLGITIGHLDKAIQPYNNLKMMEQSMVIFRVVRAPMRRAFYVDVSTMSKSRAEEYMKNMSNRFKSKLVYDADSGSWVDQKSVISMVEDYFIPRFNESKTTEIQNIDGQSSQEILEEVEYWKDKLYRALNAPISRFKSEQSSFVFGKSTEIDRDEYRFRKFIDATRNRFMVAFDDLLKKQLILKGIIKESDWYEIKKSYYWSIVEDNAFVEYKDAEILLNRVSLVQQLDPFIGRYYSHESIRKMILKQTDEEIKLCDEQIAAEKKLDNYKDPEFEE